MRTWHIVLIIICCVIYWLEFSAWHNDNELAKKYGLKQHKSWWDLCKVVLAPFSFMWKLFFSFFENLKDYSVRLKEHGGYQGYREWKKKEKIIRSQREKENRQKEKEYDRVEKAYKKGELRRDELPRYLDGIANFELYGNIFSSDWQELVYIENEYSEVFNDFFKRHPVIGLKHGIRVVYLPLCVQSLFNKDVLNYLNPDPHKTIRFHPIDTSYLLSDVCYQEDIPMLTHGLLSCSGRILNHGADTLHATYYQLEESDDGSILRQIEKVAEEVYRRNAGGLYCTQETSSKETETTNDYADEQFSCEINNLIDEIRERINMLEQRGVSRKILMNMFSEKCNLSHLLITKDMRIILTDYNNMEIKMEPINKAVFLLFLGHPKGIVFKHLPDYRKELTQIYQKLRPLGLSDRALQSIEDVTNPLLNSINEKCARIRGAFVSQFDESLAKHYYIFGNRGDAKKIDLPRDLVIWEK